MYIFNNNIKMSSKSTDNDRIWFKDFMKKSEKEPEQVLEALINKTDDEKMIKSVEETLLNDVREDEKEFNVIEMKMVKKKGKDKEIVNITIEKSLEDEDKRDDSYYKCHANPLIFKVFDKNKKDAKENAKFYEKYPERKQPGDVVTAKIKKNQKINHKEVNSNLVEDIYIKKHDPKCNKDNPFAFNPENLKEIKEKDKTNG